MVKIHLMNLWNRMFILFYSNKIFFLPRIISFVLFSFSGIQNPCNTTRNWFPFCFCFSRFKFEILICSSITDTSTEPWHWRVFPYSSSLWLQFQKYKTQTIFSIFLPTFGIQVYHIFCSILLSLSLSNLKILPWHPDMAHIPINSCFMDVSSNYYYYY